MNKISTTREKKEYSEGKLSIEHEMVFLIIKRNGGKNNTWTMQGFGVGFYDPAYSDHITPVLVGLLGEFFTFPSTFASQPHTNTHTHPHTHIYIYIYT